MELSIGVVIATYNGEEYIKEQIESILTQTVKPNLLVISDGKSNDKTVNICESVLSKSSIKYVICESDKQLNVTDNFEKGLKKCNTDLIFLADQDDVWKKNKIETFVNRMANENVDIAFSDAEIVDENLKSANYSLWESIGFINEKYSNVIKKGDSKFIGELLRHNVVTGMSMCITKKLRDMVLPFSKNALHDCWISLIASCTSEILLINERLVLYRQHSNNVVGINTSISKAYKKRYLYYDNVQKREKLIHDVILFCSKNDSSNGCIYLLKEYYSHLQNRINYMKRRITIFYPFIWISRYKKYEYNFVYIVFKDIYIRFLLRGKKNVDSI